MRNGNWSLFRITQLSVLFCQTLHIAYHLYLYHNYPQIRCLLNTLSPICYLIFSFLILTFLLLSDMILLSTEAVSTRDDEPFTGSMGGAASVFLSCRNRKLYIFIVFYFSYIRKLIINVSAYLYFFPKQSRLSTFLCAFVIFNMNFQLNQIYLRLLRQVRPLLYRQIFPAFFLPVFCIFLDSAVIL